MCARRVIKKFDQIKVVLPMKFMSLGYTIVTISSEILLYIITPHCEGNSLTDQITVMS